MLNRAPRMLAPLPASRVRSTHPLAAGIAVGCVPAAKGLLYSANPPLRVLAEALDTLGSGLIPVSLPLLGAVLYR